MRKKTETKPAPVTAKTDLFEELMDKNSNKIEQDQMIALFEKLEVAMDDTIIGYLMFIMRCKTNGEINKEEFGRLMSYVKGTTVEDIKKALPRMRKEFQSSDKFKEVYEWLFDFFKEREDLKAMFFEMAQQVWEMYLNGRFTFYK